jgi:hypothetical protein
VPNWLAVAAPILGDPSLKALRCCSPPLLILGDPSPSPPQPLIQGTSSSNRTRPAASLFEGVCARPSTRPFSGY